MQKRSVLFVCLGNICRSPMAEAVLRAKIQERNLESFFFVKSCGTASYHIGSNADDRTVQIAEKYNLPMKHVAQQISQQDFATFDYIIVMDRSNLKEVLRLKPSQSKSQVVMMRDYDPQSRGDDVPDPYYGDQSGFEACYSILNRSCEQLLNTLMNE